jgi:hypothetical protein
MLGVWRSFACERGATFRNHRRRGVFCFFVGGEKKKKCFVVRAVSSSSSVAQAKTKL